VARAVLLPRVADLRPEQIDSAMARTEVMVPGVRRPRSTRWCPRTVSRATERRISGPALPVGGRSVLTSRTDLAGRTASGESLADTIDSLTLARGAKVLREDERNSAFPRAHCATARGGEVVRDEHRRGRRDFGLDDQTKTHRVLREPTLGVLVERRQHYVEAGMIPNNASAAPMSFRASTPPTNLRCNQRIGYSGDGS